MLCGCRVDPERLAAAAAWGFSRLGPVEATVTVVEARLARGVLVERMGYELMRDPCPYHPMLSPDAYRLSYIVYFYEWRGRDYWVYERDYTRLPRRSYAVPLEPQLAEGGVLAPFTPCSLAFRPASRVRVVEVEEGGRRLHYPHR